MPVLPNAWVLKLKDMRKKKQRPPDPMAGNDHDDDAVSPNPRANAFFPKAPAAKNSLRKQSPNRVFSPVRPSDHGFGAEPRCSSPVNHKAFDIAHPFASPAKNLVRTPSPRRTPSKTTPPPSGGVRGQTSPASIDSGCTYKSTMTSFRRKAGGGGGGDAGAARKETLSAGSLRKVAPRVNPRGTTARTRHASLDMDTVDCLFDFDKCLRRVDRSVGRATSRAKEDPWSVELNKCALVKQQLFLKKRREATPKAAMMNPWGSPEMPPVLEDYRQFWMPPVLEDYRQKLAIADTVSQWIAQTPEPGCPVTRPSAAAAAACVTRSLSRVFKEGDDTHHAAAAAAELRPNSWGSCSSLASDDSMFTTSFELPRDGGLKDSAKSSSSRNRWSTSDSGGGGGGITSSAEMDRAIENFNALDDKALLTVDQAANLLTAGSRFCREAAAEDQAAGRSPSDVSEDHLSAATAAVPPSSSGNLAQLERGSGSFSRSASPKLSVYHGPRAAVCPQEAAAKTWAQVEFPVFEGEAAGGASPVGPFDLTRESYHNGGAHPGDKLTAALGANNVRREARRAKRLADLEALASARRKSASRLKGNKSHHAETRHPLTKPGREAVAPAKTRKTTVPTTRRDDLVEQAKGHYIVRHHRRFSKEVTMPHELIGVVKESVALVKNSYNPYGDFKESMIEMIVEKDIQESGDLEELLQCYLSLNCEEYHNVIVEVFTEVWKDLFESNS